MEVKYNPNGSIMSFNERRKIREPEIKSYDTYYARKGMIPPEESKFDYDKHTEIGMKLLLEAYQENERLKNNPIYH